MGPRAKLKKQMKEEGKLDKFGRPNELTPSGWNPGKNVVEDKNKKVEHEEKEENSLKRKKSEEKEKKKKKKDKKKKEKNEDSDVSME